MTSIHPWSMLSARDRRTLIAGAAMVSALIFVARVIPMWYGWQKGIRERARLTVDEAAAGQMLVRSLPAMRRALESDTRYYTSATSAFLEGSQPAAVSASLTAAVSTAASENNVRVGTLQLIPDVRADSLADDGILRVAVRGDAAADIRGVTHFLADLEAGTPFFVVRELKITQADPGAPPDRPEALRVEFVVAALARGPARHDNNTARIGNGGGLPPHMRTSSVVAPRQITMYDAMTLAQTADSVTADDPFRLNRQAAHTPFGLPAAAGPPVPPPPRIQPVLGGIVGGPPWRAVLSGIPGREGSTVVNQGDTLGGFTIRSIRRNTVIVEGRDTTWTLTSKP